MGAKKLHFSHLKQGESVKMTIHHDIFPDKKAIKTQRKLIKLINEPPPQIIKDCTFRPIQSTHEFRVAAHLVYLEYLRRKYTLPNQGKLRISLHQIMTKSNTFLAVFQDRYIVGTMTFIVDSPFGLPIEKPYKREIDKLRQNGAKIAEATMLALNNNILDQLNVPQSLRLLLLMHLFRKGFRYLLEKTEVNHVVACFHPRHELFYQALQFRPIGGLTTYSGVQHNPAVAYILNMDNPGENTPVPLLQFFGLTSPREIEWEEGRPFKLNLSDFGNMFLNASPATDD